jgi:PAB-dependent poly(A)-specific ribonuclease subunit 2
MEADWNEVSRVAVPAANSHTLPTIATTIAFDDVQDLLWVGNEYVSLLLSNHYCDGEGCC